MVWGSVHHPEVTRDDMALLEAWRGGDNRAGSELFSRYFDELYGFFCSKVPTGDLAEDLVQQTLLSCVRYRDGFRGDASFRTYLFAVARSRLYDFYRRRGKGEPPAGVSSLIDPGRSPSSLFRSDERRRVLLEALGQLSFDQQLVLELHYVRGFTGPELAQILAVPEGTVRSRLRRARAALIQHIARVDAKGVDEDEVHADLESWAGAVHEAAGLRERGGR